MASRRVGEHASGSTAQLLGTLIPVPADQETGERRKDQVGRVDRNHHQEADGDRLAGGGLFSTQTLERVNLQPEQYAAFMREDFERHGEQIRAASVRKE